MARKPRAKKGAEAPVQDQTTESAGRPELTGQKSGDGLPEVSVGEALASASSKVMPQSSAPSGCEGPADTKTNQPQAQSTQPTTRSKPMSDEHHMQDTSETSDSKKGPVARFSHGGVQVSLFKNTGINGEFFNAQLQTFRKEGDQYKYGQSLGTTDMLLAIEALHEAYRYAIAERRKQSMQRRAENSPS